MAAEEDLKPLKNSEQLLGVSSREPICPRPLVVAMGAAMFGRLTNTSQKDGFAATSGAWRGPEKPFIPRPQLWLVRETGRFLETQALGGKNGVG